MTSLARLTGLLLCSACMPLMAQEPPGSLTGDAPIEAAAPKECDPSSDVIRVGVRNDARPFSYELLGTRRSDSKLPRPENRYYDGYVARICGSVMAEVQRVHEARFAVCPVEDPRERFNLLESGAIDILCDPSTITDERLEKLMSSPPIYLSGITVAIGTDSPIVPCGARIGVVGGTTSDQYGIREVLKAGEFPKLTKEIREALQSNVPSQGCLEMAEKAGGDAAAYREPPIFLGKSHDEVARRFCNHEIAYYVGDIEIVKANLNAIPNCTHSGASATYTDERYAIFGHVPENKAEAAKAAGILEFFRELSRQALNKDSVLISSYNSTFPDATPSVKLKALYWSLTGVYPVRE